MKRFLLSTFAGVSALLIGACDNGPSAVAKTDREALQRVASADAPADRGRDESSDGARERGGDRDQGPQVDHRSEAALKIDGEALWASTRRRSAEDGARYSFERNGRDFDAADVEAYVRKAHAFVSHPPAGAERMARRNGDTLIYDPRSNTFAVADKAGLPKTMFKPEEGAAYWRDQKDRDSRQTARQSGRRSGADHDEG